MPDRSLGVLCASAFLIYDPHRPPPFPPQAAPDRVRSRWGLGASRHHARRLHLAPPAQDDQPRPGGGGAERSETACRRQPAGAPWRRCAKSLSRPAQCHPLDVRPRRHRRPTHHGSPSLISWTFDHLSTRGEMVVLLPGQEEMKHFGNLLIRSFRREVQHAIAAHCWLRVSPATPWPSSSPRPTSARSRSRLDLALLDEEMLKEKAGAVRSGGKVRPSSTRATSNGRARAASTTPSTNTTGRTDKGGVLHRNNVWIEGGVLRWVRWIPAPAPAADPLDEMKRMEGFTVGASTGRAEAPPQCAAQSVAPRSRRGARCARNGAAVDARQRAPFYPLVPEQRLGWLAGLRTIHCTPTPVPSRPGRITRCAP